MVALSAAIVICVTGIASWKQVQENTEWGVLFLFGGGLTLSSVLDPVWRKQNHGGWYRLHH